MASLGEGSIIISLDSTRLTQGIKKAAAEAKKGGSEISKSFKDSSKEKIGELAGGGSVLGMGAKAGLVGAGIAGIASLGASLWKAFGPLKDVTKEIERSSEAHKTYLAALEESVNVNKEWADSLSDIAGTAEGMAQVEGRIASIGKTAVSAQADLNKLKKKDENLDSWGSLDSWSSWARGTLEEKKNGVKAEMDAAKSSLESIKKTQDELEKQQNRRRNPLTNPEAVASVRQFVQEMEDAAAAAKGASAEMLKIDGMKRKFNLNDEQVGQLRQAAALKMAAEAAAELKKQEEEAAASAAELIQSLSEDAGLVAKKSIEESKLEELVKKGLDEEQANRIRGLIALKKQATTEYKALTGLEMGSSAERSFQNKNKFEQERNKVLEAQRKELENQTNLLKKIHDDLNKSEPDLTL